MFIPEKIYYEEEIKNYELGKELLKPCLDEQFKLNKIDKSTGVRIDI